MVKPVGPNKWKMSTMANLSSSKGASKKCNLVIDNARRNDPLPTFREQDRIISIFLISLSPSPGSPGIGCGYYGSRARECLIDCFYLLAIIVNRTFGRDAIALPK